MTESHIIISKKNEAFLHVSGDPGVLMELSETLTFEVPGYRFTPAYKSGRWDGRIRLYNLASKTMYAGLYNKLIEFCESRKYTYTLESTGYYSMPGVQENLGFDDIAEYMKSLELSSSGKLLEIRDYQINAVHIALRDTKALLLSATSSGKSMIQYSICRHILENDENAKILMVVPTVSLTTQMFKDFDDYSSKNGWNAEENMHLISAGKDKKTNKPITISTFQSIAELPASYFNKFDVVLVDEAHRAVAKSITSIFEKCTEAKYRLGFTGTVQDSKCNVLVLQGLTGPIHSIVSTKELIQNKQASGLNLNIVILDHKEEINKAFKHSEYDDEVKYLVSNERRNKFIRNLALQTTGTTLVLFRFVDLQGKPLYNLIKDATQDRDVYFIDGGAKKEAREEVRIVAKDRPIVIVASYGTFSTGVNIPTIENIIFAHPTKSKITSLQSIGRGIRLSEGKSECNVYDVSDNMTYKKYVNHTYKHLSERIKIYTSEGFKFKITKIPF